MIPKEAYTSYRAASCSGGKPTAVYCVLTSGLGSSAPLTPASSALAASCDKRQSTTLSQLDHRACTVVPQGWLFIFWCHHWYHAFTLEDGMELPAGRGTLHALDNVSKMAQHTLTSYPVLLGEPLNSSWGKAKKPYTLCIHNSSPFVNSKQMIFFLLHTWKKMCLWVGLWSN